MITDSSSSQLSVDSDDSSETCNVTAAHGTDSIGNDQLIVRLLFAFSIRFM